MSDIATGSFEVELTPRPGDDDGSTSGIARLSIKKRFDGDLAGESTGQMLTVNSEIPGSAGYVAMERVTATLADRSGTFALQHDGAMSSESSRLSISVVPDSGTGGLTGISGSMVIEVVDGRHLYSFDYVLSD